VGRIGLQLLDRRDIRSYRVPVPRRSGNSPSNRYDQRRRSFMKPGSFEAVDPDGTCRELYSAKRDGYISNAPDLELNARIKMSPEARKIKGGEAAGASTSRTRRRWQRVNHPQL
jgi:hypothetical protein